MKLPECDAHPGAAVSVDFERTVQRCYEFDVVERCVLCGRRISAFGVLWKGGIPAQWADDDGA